MQFIQNVPTLEPIVRFFYHFPNLFLILIHSYYLTGESPCSYQRFALLHRSLPRRPHRRLLKEFDSKKLIRVSKETGMR